MQLGVQTYSFRTLSSLDEILKAIVTVRLGEAELMYNQVEEAFAKMQRNEVLRSVVVFGDA